MKIETLRERISKAEEKIVKKQNTISKKTAAVEKKQAELAKTVDERERWGIECDIGWLEDDLKRLASEIKETEKTLENYRKQLDGEIKRQDLLTKEVPETLKTLQKELVAEWNEYDKNRKAKMLKDYKELSYDDFKRKYRGQDMQFRYKTDEEINRDNERDAESIILNLVNRVKGITGEITDWGNLFLSRDNMGYSILNGFVQGKEGRCEVESIGAGGYNIQRYHIRVLVKPIN
jgi:glucan-binding YG repeat protein